MKILIISDAWHPQINGVVRTYEYLSEELEKRGHEVKVIGPHEFPMRIPMPGYAEIELALFPYHTLKKQIEAFAPDHIHLSTEGPLGWAGRKYCLKHNRKYSSSYHTQFPDYSAKRIAKYLPFMYDFIHKHGINFVRKFHADSGAMMVATQSLEETLRGWGFKNPISRLIRGVNLDIFKPGPKTLFKNLQGPIALYVGRIAIEKNIEDFLRMTWQGTKVLVGDGPARTELEKAYTDAIFAGIKTKEELGDYYRSADVFIFPSRTDTFGMVLIEALACGLPVAAYNVTGPKDIITNETLGALTEKDLSLAAENALKHGTSPERSKYTHETYRWEKVAEQYETAIKSLYP